MKLYQLISTAAVSTWVALALPLQAITPPVAAVDAPKLAAQSIQRLSGMFSPDIQATLAACQSQGKVNISAGPDQDGSVICGDQSRTSPVQYTTYVETLSDIIAAIGVAGVHSYIQQNRISPRFAASLARTPNGTQTIQKELHTALSDSAIVAGTPPESVNLLANNVTRRALPILQNPTALTRLYGTVGQYQQVVRSFCTAPGSSLQQVKAAVPQLTPVQLYAICVKESGLADEILSQLVQ